MLGTKSHRSHWRHRTHLRLWCSTAWSAVILHRRLPDGRLLNRRLDITCLRVNVPTCVRLVLVWHWILDCIFTIIGFLMNCILAIVGLFLCFLLPRMLCVRTGPCSIQSVYVRTSRI